MQKIKTIFILLLFSSGLCCQSAEDAIRKTAIECKNSGSSNQRIYTFLKNYRFICIGEMHGTKEPAEFLTGLVKTFIENNHRVIVAFEIPEESMRQFQPVRDSVTLLNTDFFSGQTIDGRASEAWFRAINDCNKLGVQFCFFDSAKPDADLGMYEKLIECYKSDTAAAVLTLSGNIHNKIVPHHTSKNMGCYLKEHFGDKVFSINHIYNGGTMYNKTSEGLKIHSLQQTNTVFSSATEYESYLLPNIFNIDDYSGFFFTQTVTASLPKKK